MAVLNWGDLTKSQDDSETIEQAIERLIAAHNAAETAHQDTGQALDNHKAADVIDHPAGSVVSDKLAQARLLITAFESLDGWNQYKTGSANIIQEFGAITLVSGATSNSEAYLSAAPSGWTPFDTAKEFFLKITARITANTNQYIRFGTGALGGGDGLSGAGFEIEDGTLYAYTEDNEDVDRTEITGVTIQEWNIYEVRYDPATNTFTFYVNGVLKHTEVRIYNVTQDDNLAVFGLKNTAAESKYVYISDMVFQLQP